MSSQSTQLRLNTTLAPSSHNTGHKEPQNSHQFILKPSDYQLGLQFHNDGILSWKLNRHQFEAIFKLQLAKLTYIDSKHY